MKKIIVILSVLAIVGFMYSPVLANDVCDKHPWQPGCQGGGGGGDVEVDVDNNIGNATTLFGDANSFSPSATADVDIDNEINADFENNVRAYGGDGGSVDMNAGSVFGDANVLSPSATVGDISNRNENKNTNLNTNINNNENDNTNVNLQGQHQGQSQVGINANKQVMVYKEAKNPIDYSHIGSGVKKTDADMAEQKEDVSTIRTLSSIFKYDDDNFITMDEAKKASGNADIDVEKALLWAPKLDGQELTLKNLNYVEVSGKYMGSLTLTTEDATADQIIAQAAEEAMKAGATSAKFIVRDAKRISGTKYGIDLGTSASVALNPDTGSAVLAPGSTLGWSKAKSQNMLVSEVYVELFFDGTTIVAE